MQDKSGFQHNAQSPENSGLKPLFAALDNISDILILLDPNLDIIFIGEASAQKIHDITGTYISAGENLSQFIAPSCPALFRQLTAMIEEAKENKQEFLFNIHGQDKIFDFFFKPVKHGGEPEYFLITAKDRTEEKRSLEKYRYFFYNHPIAMWKYDTASLKIIEANDAALALYGYNNDEFLNLTIKDLRPAEDIPKLEEELKTLNKDHSQTHTICRHKKKSGEIFYVEVFGREIFPGIKNRRLESVIDVTEKIKVENELKLSHERFEMASIASSDALWEWNPLTREFFISPAYSRILGRASNEYFKLDNWHENIHPDDKADTIKKYFDSLSDPKIFKWEMNYRLKKSDGTYAFISDKAIVTRDETGKAIRVVGALKDITIEKQAEEDLRRSNERFILASKAASDAIYEWEIENDHLYWGEGFYTLFQYSEPVRTIIEWKKLVHPQDREIASGSLQHVLKNPAASFWKSDYRFKKNDHTYRHVLDRGYIIRNKEGKAIKMIGSIQDITERRLGEDLLAIERTVFEMTSNPDIKIEKVVDYMLQGIGSLHPEAMAAFLFVDENFNAGYVSAPVFPEFEILIKGKIEHSHGSFGSAIYSKQPVSVYVMDQEAFYQKHLKVIKKYNILSCWSFPIVQNTGRVIGCFTLFFKTAREPGAEEKYSIERLSSILRIVWENHWSLQEIKIANERFDNMMKATHDLIWDWNMETNEFYRDPSGVLNVYGISDPSKISNFEKWVEHIHPDDRRHLQKLVGKILNSKRQNQFDMEYRFRKDDGTYSHVYSRGTVIRNTEGKPVRMIGAAQDISERKRLERELLSHELEHQKAINLATVETQEQERREIGKELHDNVNQVLTTTKLYLELAGDNAEMKDELIKKSVQNIRSVINEIRQLSRSLMDPTIGDLGLLSSINDLIENIQLTGKLKIKLEADESVEQRFDANQKLTIFRIIQEALNNAIKHAQAGIVLIKFTLEERQATVIIEDNGVGFDMKTIKTGIGLKNIQNRIYLINGTHKIESMPYKGSRIIIKFPISKTK